MVVGRSRRHVGLPFWGRKFRPSGRCELLVSGKVSHIG